MSNEPKFKPEDKDHLYRVFQPDEHESRVMYSVGKKVDHPWKKDRSGKVEKVHEWSVYSVYIKRDAIINRLNEQFFGEWSSGFLDQQNPCIYHKDHVDCSMHMTIKGVRMEYNGSQSGTGENGAKGAATDAFKRVASQWGIGLYLQQAPTIMTKNPDLLDKSERKQAEKEVERKIQQWVNSLLSGQSEPKDDKTIIEETDFTPPPQGSKPKTSATKSSPDNDNPFVDMAKRRLNVLEGTLFNDMNDMMRWASANGVDWNNSSADIIEYIKQKAS